MQMETHHQKRETLRDKKDWILLDSGSSVGLFHNRNLVKNVKKTDRLLELATNVGTRRNDTVAEVPAYGEVWFDQDAIANVFSLAEMVDQYRVTFDSAIEDAFHVHLPDKVIKFKRSPEGLYFYPVSEEYKDTMKKSTVMITLNQHRVM